CRPGQGGRPGGRLCPAWPGPAEFSYLSDPGSRAAIEFGIFGVPETVFISGGVIVGKFLGETDALTLTGALERLLAGQNIESRQVGEFRRSRPDRT
ncbi:MAG: hypothetical protein OXH89_00180, partial [bacterium]|nr:hypothetical protein [bacterium]